MYNSIPIIGDISSAILLLIGAAIYFTFKLCFAYTISTLPEQVFHMLSAFGGVPYGITGQSYERTDFIYIIIGIVIIVWIFPIVFGGIKHVTKVTDVMVSIMAIVYFIMHLS